MSKAPKQTRIFFQVDSSLWSKADRIAFRERLKTVNQLAKRMFVAQVEKAK